MPANLPPDYFEAEQRFREAKTPEANVEALEEMLAIIPKHKGTDKLKAILRERISKLKDEAGRRKGGAKAHSVYYIEREGAAQMTLAGPPNSGKSSLIRLITNASPGVAPFPHTTHRPTPGMAHYEDIRFQIIGKMLVAVNKMDSPQLEEDFEVFRELSGTKLPCLGISVRSGRNIMIFLERLYDLAEIVRVYTKRPGKEADRTVQFIVPVGSTLEELAGRIHNDFAGKLK